MKAGAIKVVAVNVLLSAAGILLALGAGECYLRLRYSSYDLFDAGWEMPWFRNNPEDITKLLTVDPDIGFSPILPGVLYNAHGTLHNGYELARRPGTRRVLFIGDSVTAAGYIVDALREIYGDDGFEYWNAGVESFNTTQELRYYKKHNREIRPDHVVLTFHNNDFETTPIVYMNEEGRMVLFSPFLPRGQFNETLFARSHLYRLYIGKRIALRRDAARREIAAEVRQSMTELRDLLSRDGTAFTVLVHPILLPRESWSPSQVENHERALEMLQGLGIRHFDLSPPLWSAIAEGVSPAWDKWEGDTWHPSVEMARRFARFLAERGLLEDGSRGGDRGRHF